MPTSRWRTPARRRRFIRPNASMTRKQRRRTNTLRRSKAASLRYWAQRAARVGAQGHRRQRPAVATGWRRGTAGAAARFLRRHRRRPSRSGRNQASGRARSARRRPRPTERGSPAARRPASGRSGVALARPTSSAWSPAECDRGRTDRASRRGCRWSGLSARCRRPATRRRTRSRRCRCRSIERVSVASRNSSADRKNRPGSTNTAKP